MLAFFVLRMCYIDVENLVFPVHVNLLTISFINGQHTLILMHCERPVKSRHKKSNILLLSAPLLIMLFEHILETLLMSET